MIGSALHQPKPKPDCGPTEQYCTFAEAHQAIQVARVVTGALTHHAQFINKVNYLLVNN
jgi:hypothetical protein